MRITKELVLLQQWVEHGIVLRNELEENLTGKIGELAGLSDL